MVTKTKTTKRTANSTKSAKSTKTSKTAKAPVRSAASRTKKTDTTQDIFDFVSMLVHDLESPIASMKYALGLVRSKRYNSENELHQRVINSAHVASERAEDLVGDILAVAQSERNGLQATMVKVDLCDMAKRSIELSFAAGEERGVTVMLDQRNVLDCSVFVSADASLLSRTLDNLIYNAIRHTPEGGQVVLSVLVDEKSSTIAVTDTGIGMQSVNPNELFEKFGQVKHRKAAQHRGVGLGLYFCRLAADAMHAEIFAENTKDSGARFGLRFTTIDARQRKGSSAG